MELKKIITIIIVGLGLAALAAGIFVGVRKVRDFLFPVETRTSTVTLEGNTGGNLYNGGMFCEKNGTVYFANPNDGYRLYCMSVFGGECMKLCEDSVAYINADDNYIYYTRRANSDADDDFMGITSVYSYALCRVDPNGKNQVILDSDPCMCACLVGDFIYYLHYDKKNSTDVYRIGIDGENREKVSSGTSLTCSAYDNVLYYNGTQTDHNLYSINAHTGSLAMIYEGNAWQPTYSNGYLYFLNLTDDYTLCRIDLGTYEAVTLIDESVQDFNIHGNTIYYQTMKGDVGLYSYDINTGDSALIYEGNCCDICVTSAYLYFRTYEVEDVYYMTPVNSALNIQVFVPPIT